MHMVHRLFRYYMVIQNDLDKASSWTDPLYKLMRTQSAVTHKWGKEVCPIKACTLFLWLLFIMTTIMVFINHIGVFDTPAVNLVHVYV